MDDVSRLNLHDDEDVPLVLEGALHGHDKRMRDLRHEISLPIDVVHLEE